MALGKIKLEYNFNQLASWHKFTCNSINCSVAEWVLPNIFVL